MKFELDPDNPPSLSENQLASLEALKEMADSEIDYSDIPDESLYRPVKKMTACMISPMMENPTD
jgi:hypothetical protein